MPADFKKRLERAAECNQRVKAVEAALRAAKQARHDAERVLPPGSVLQRMPQLVVVNGDHFVVSADHEAYTYTKVTPA